MKTNIQNEFNNFFAIQVQLQTAHFHFTFANTNMPLKLFTSFKNTNIYQNEN